MPNLHANQRAIVFDESRFIVAPCGRRFGKTRGAIAWALSEMAKQERGVGFWVAPRYKQTRVPWRLMRRLTRQVPGTTILEAERIIRLPNESEAAFHTGDDPGSLQSEGLRWVVIDEAHDVHADVWHEAIRPSLMDTGGRALVVGRGAQRGWFYDLWQKGNAGEPGYRSFHFSSFDNPYLDPAEIDAYLNDPNIPESVKRAHVFAEFVADEGDVFRRVRECSCVRPAEPVRGARYVGFLDLADTHDFNGLVAFRVDGDFADCPTQVVSDRWNRVDLSITVGRANDYARRYPGEWYIDASSLGGAIAREHFPTFIPFRFTNESKRNLVNVLRGRLENDAVRLLDPTSSNAAQAQYDELIDFQATQLPSGLYRYEAPSGKHDDLAVAVMGAVFHAADAGEDAYAVLDALGL